MGFDIKRESMLLVLFYLFYFILFCTMDCDCGYNNHAFCFRSLWMSLEYGIIVNNIYLIVIFYKDTCEPGIFIVNCQHR